MKVKVKVSKKVNDEQILISKETCKHIIDDKGDLTLCLTLFVTMYNYIKDCKDNIPYTLKFCVDEGVNLVKKRYPDSCWKDVKSLVTNEESSTQPEKDKTSFNATTIDASQLKCPCYGCLDWNEKLLRCKGIQRDCIKYHNGYSNTFNY